MFTVGAELFNHPVAQASDGLKAIESYRLTQSSAYLDQALADATRLVETRVESRNAWFYPYPFDFQLHGSAVETIRAPWYSGMAQGQALSLFVRLAEATGDPQWRVAAESTLTSFTLPPDLANPSVPFVTWVDENDNLWLEEYAQLPLTATDRTINGHLFAMFGLWDAARLLHDDRASAAFSGAAATIRRHILTSSRVPGWISKYCLEHVVLSDRYHLTVTGQLATIFGYTGATDWARFSDTFRDDYPSPAVAGTVDLAKGKVTGYKFDSAGRQVASKSLTLTRSSSAPASSRQRVRGHGIYFRVSSGALTGYLVPEKLPRGEDAWHLRRHRLPPVAHRRVPRRDDEWLSGRRAFGPHQLPRDDQVGETELGTVRPGLVRGWTALRAHHQGRVRQPLGAVCGPDPALTPGVRAQAAPADGLRRRAVAGLSDPRRRTARRRGRG